MLKKETEMSPKLICHKNWNIIKTVMSPKQKSHKNWNVTKTKWHQKWNVTKAVMSLKLKCHLNEMLPKLKCYQNWNVTKSKNQGDQGEWHWSPWSCYWSMLVIQLNSIFMFQYKPKQGQGNQWS